MHRDIPTAMHKINGNLIRAIAGIAESPDKWSLFYWNEEIGNVVMGGMQTADVLLLGRVTYQGSPRPGPTVRTKTISGAGFMNNIKKYVVSSTLTKVDWNNSSLLERQVADSVRELKESGNGEIAMSGSPISVRSLLQLKLLDELNLLMYP